MTLAFDAAEIAGKLHERWTAAFDRRDWNLLAALYTDKAQLFGSKPDLFTSREGVLRYFEGMPPGTALTAKFGVQHVTQVAADVIVSAGQVAFLRAAALAEPRHFRITLVLVVEDGEWRIANHHASPR